ncbi:ketopantoate reductase family protein [uncultured Microbacterium sp.]|uniref:ketopantoate reductase family protein n=1 Tax=uncultured Microbacterium sp. TaxID=191216 RepID=UPI0028D1B39B|nr:ketopantoate reductase family protein [uncultured Microbacterium sp.]
MSRRVCIVGCGAIGGLFAAHLAAAPDVEVWALDASKQLVDAINADGIRITGRTEFTARVNARTDAGSIPPCELGIVATKSAFTEAAISAAAGIFVDGSVASVQNGVGNEEIIARHVSRVIRGTTLVAGAVTGAGVIRFDAPGDTWLGPFEASPAPLADVALLARLLNEGGMPTHASADSRTAQWIKLVFNAATNAVGAITGLTIGQLGSSESLRPLVAGLIAEGQSVARVQGISFGDEPQEMIEDAVQHAFWHRASMLQDVTARRRTEVDVLNGGISAAGRRYDVPTPLNDAMVSLIEGIESSWDTNPLADEAHG